jgi:hypothetical protein
MGRFFGFLIVLGLIAFGVAYVGSPWLAFRQLGEAAQAHDQDRLDALVDYPAVREGMKGQVDSGATKLSRTVAGVGFAPVQAVGKLGTMRGDRKIRKLIAPDALAGLVRGAPSYAYLTPDRVRVAVARQQRPPAGFVLERRGLFAWKLVKLELPGEKIRPAD